MHGLPIPKIINQSTCGVSNDIMFCWMLAKLGSEPEYQLPKNVSADNDQDVCSKMLAGVSLKRLFHGSLVKPVISHQRWLLPAAWELLKELLKGWRTILFLSCRGNKRLLYIQNIALQSGRKRSAWATVTGTMKIVTYHQQKTNTSSKSILMGRFVFCFVVYLFFTFFFSHCETE